MQFTIPCETIARLSNVITHVPDDASDWFRTIRIDGSLAVACNQRILVVERLPNKQPDGVFHLVCDPVLISQCRTEAAFNSSLDVLINEPLRYATAKTTLGYVYGANAALWVSSEANDMDAWRDIVPLDRATSSYGAMFSNTQNLIDISASSPSGRIVFEEIIDTRRPTIIRDMLDPNWFAVSIMSSTRDNYSPATLPEWFK